MIAALVSDTEWNICGSSDRSAYSSSVSKSERLSFAEVTR
jgi:hypothetical protein